MRLLPLLLLLSLSGALAGCVGDAEPVRREDLAFPVVSRVAGVDAAPSGELNVTGSDGVLVLPDGDRTGLVIGLAAVVQSNVFQACRAECRNLSVVPGTLLAEAHVASLRNASLNAAGPDGDSALFFYDNGAENGRFLRWHDASASFQMNADLQAIGNVTGTGHVGTVMPLVLQNGAIVTVSTAAMEGVEPVVFARGRGTLVNGTMSIPMPPAFTAVTDDTATTAQVTLTSRGPALYVESVTNEHITVRAAEGNPTGVTFDWLVQAKRKGGDAFEV